jgi:hypothetical protein
MRAIKRAALLSPLAVLTSACALRPWTPSVSVAYWSDSADLRETSLPARADVLRAWQLPPNDAWGRYAKYTLITSLDESPTQAELPDVTALDAVARARAAGERIAAAGLPEDTMWIVDLRGAASVAFGATVSRTAREPVSCVPTFNNWPAEDELIPAEETLAALATMAPRPPDDDAAGSRPMFLLDAWRLAYRFDAPDDDTYDNRYILNPSDLPAVDDLRAHGIRRVIYVVDSLDDTTTEEDDLHVTFLEWERAGISIAMVDLDGLQRVDGPRYYNEEIVHYWLYVYPRVTIIDDPHFYVRARGGFGGVYARPSPVFRGGGWAGGHGGHGSYGGHGGGG